MRYPTPEEWLQLVAEYRSSGLTQKQFVAKHDISYATLQYWLYVRAKKVSVSSQKLSAKFLPVTVVASPAPKARQTELIEAAVGGVVLRFVVGTDTRYVAELLAALG